MSFTWSQKSPRIFCRLDYWLISNNLNDLVRSTDIIPAIRTDHDAIFLEIGKLQNKIKGPGHWKIIQKFGFINGVDNVNWPPYRDSKS